MKKTGGAPSFSKQPYFKQLKVEIWASEPDSRLGLDEEIVSSLEALHDEIYFDTLDFLRGITDLDVEDETLPEDTSRYSAPGNVFPIIHPSSEGEAPRIKVTLEDWPASSPRPRPQVEGEGQGRIHPPDRLPGAQEQGPHRPLADLQRSRGEDREHRRGHGVRARGRLPRPSRDRGLLPGARRKRASGRAPELPQPPRDPPPSQDEGHVQGRAAAGGRARASRPALPRPAAQAGRADRGHFADPLARGGPGDRRPAGEPAVRPDLQRRPIV